MYIIQIPACRIFEIPILKKKKNMKWEKKVILDLLSFHAGVHQITFLWISMSTIFQVRSLHVPSGW